MPWRKLSVISRRLELTGLMQLQDRLGVVELTQRFGVSRETAYKWMERHRAGER